MMETKEIKSASRLPPAQAQHVSIFVPLEGTRHLPVYAQRIYLWLYYQSHTYNPIPTPSVGDIKQFFDNYPYRESEIRKLREAFGI